jgi:hypothetical protein
MNRSRIMWIHYSESCGFTTVNRVDSLQYHGAAAGAAPAHCSSESIWRESHGFTISHPHYRCAADVQRCRAPAWHVVNRVDSLQ